jgi:tRNA-uridine 2-sulfurtransferase
MSKLPTVFVGLSGGVDSSVAALRLKKKGYNVVGVFIKVWHPDFMVCNWESERLDAMRVAAHLEIPFLTCDAEATYRDEVAHYFIEEYKAGRTPNPDVLCNKEVKFGAFLRFAKENGADFVATGHYVQRVKGKSGIELHRGMDTNKDQSYFLWSLSQEQLDTALFPVGTSQKSEIRHEAAKAGIPTATKKDSQGVCFLGHIDIRKFLSHYTEIRSGNVLDTRGAVIGTHGGALVYTIGQRHGFTLVNKNKNRKTMYVIAKNLAQNTITVDSERHITTPNETTSLSNVMLRNKVVAGDIFDAQFRYRQKPFPIKIVNFDNNDATIKILERVETAAVGQSCVIYNGTHCLGGGMIA